MCKRIEVSIDLRTGKLIGIDAEALVDADMGNLEAIVAKALGEATVVRESREYHEPHVRIKSTSK